MVAATETVVTIATDNLHYKHTSTYTHVHHFSVGLAQDVSIISYNGSGMNGKFPIQTFYGFKQTNHE